MRNVAPSSPEAGLLASRDRIAAAAAAEQNRATDQLVTDEPHDSRRPDQLAVFIGQPASNQYRHCFEIQLIDADYTNIETVFSLSARNRARSGQTQLCYNVARDWIPEWTIWPVVRCRTRRKSRPYQWFTHFRNRMPVEFGHSVSFSYTVEAPIPFDSRYLTYSAHWSQLVSGASPQFFVDGPVIASAQVTAERTSGTAYAESQIRLGQNGAAVARTPQGIAHPTSLLGRNGAAIAPTVLDMTPEETIDVLISRVSGAVNLQIPGNFAKLTVLPTAGAFLYDSLVQNLQGWWSFNGSGHTPASGSSWPDEYRHARHATENFTATHEPTKAVRSLHGNAVAFNPVDYQSVADHADIRGAQDLSIYLAFKLPEVSTWTFLEKPNNYSVFLNASRQVVFRVWLFGGGTHDFTSTIQIDPDTDYKVICRWDETSAPNVGYIWINGTEVSANEVTNGNSTADNLTFGDSSGNSPPQLDIAAIWNRLLSTSQKNDLLGEGADDPVIPAGKTIPFFPAVDAIQALGL